MGADLGGIDYDEAAALYPGASFPEGQDSEFVKTEVLLVEKDGEILEDSDVDAPENERELEALAIAGKIRSMVGHDLVLDKETGEYRPVRRYCDPAPLCHRMGRDFWGSAGCKRDSVLYGVPNRIFFHNRGCYTSELSPGAG